MMTAFLTVLDSVILVSGKFREALLFFIPDMPVQILIRDPIRC